ncbi:MAG: recombinase family protein [Cyanomargarita calcarea GSE-NOS-MK-12-04C]|jgi:DNA invertase Pin-like site-specific DNA recombinase|uniref:Recombinase family protein n=1 Tax=Cyanomargarita calcarea GSE-NOS-MK-12-04C TaxID=2839659 RepID=A0A951UQN9_9CYAN|nr:recombinase family protein [Cyanomargarita calcarea GSE-NOS-MK-12-04C]
MIEKWFYGRVSTIEQQEDRNALKKQLERGKNAGCDRFYWDIQSRTTEVREGLQQLINDLKISPKGTISELVVTRIDRIGSSSKLFYSLLEVLRSRGIRLIALDQTIDTESLGGELTIDILLAASKFEIKMLSSRVSAERKHRMTQRKSHRFAPLGWKVENDIYIKDESWCVSLLDGKRSFRVWELAKLVFDVFGLCGSVRKTCNTLNEMVGTPGKIEARSPDVKRKHLISAENLDSTDFSSNTKKTFKRYPWASLQWSPAGLKNFLVNPVHAGGTPFNVTTSSPSKGKQISHFDKWDCNWDTHEGIITREQHEQIKRIIRSNANNKWAATAGDTTNPFANLVKCGRCGGALTRMSSRRDRRKGDYTAYYQCTHYSLGRCDAKEMISSRSLDNQVAANLVREATRLASMVDFGEEKHLEPASVKELRETLAGLDKLPTNHFVEKAKDGISDQIASILSLHEKATKRSLLVREELVQMFCDREYWDSRTPEDKKRMLNRLVRRIIVDGRVLLGIEFF